MGEQSSTGIGWGWTIFLALTGGLLAVIVAGYIWLMVGLSRWADQPQGDPIPVEPVDLLRNASYDRELTDEEIERAVWPDTFDVNRSAEKIVITASCVVYEVVLPIKERPEVSRRAMDTCAPTHQVTTTVSS